MVGSRWGESPPSWQFVCGVKRCGTSLWQCIAVPLVAQYGFLYELLPHFSFRRCEMDWPIRIYAWHLVRVQ